MAHFLTAGFRSKLVSDKNSIRICTNIIGQPARQLRLYSVDINLIENSDKLDIEKCGICSAITLYPIIFPCGHLICGFCYVRHFKLHHYYRFNTYFTKCPDCSEYIDYSASLTIHQEISCRPKSNPSMFYQNARISCLNPACNQVLSLVNWDYHMQFCCDHRSVKCPAIQCSFTGTPIVVMNHSVRCIYHMVWCAGCKVNWTVLATGHNCESSKEFSKLVGCVSRPPGLSIPTKHGEVVLTNLFTPVKTPDILALEEVEYLVSTYRYKSRYQ